MPKPDSSFPRIFLTQTAYAPSFAHSNPVRLSREVRDTYLQGVNQPFPLVDRAQDADIVVFWEEYQASEQTLAPKLRAAARGIGDPDKVFVVSGEDRSAGFLPGVYVSTPQIGWDEHRFRTGAYFKVMNPLVGQAAEARSRKPTLLYSFIGSATTPIRQEIFRTLRSNDRRWIQDIGDVRYWVDVESADKRPGQQAYLEKMLDSVFVLCPRGGGESSFRLFETMQLGRVPVILSDAWVAPRGPRWQDFSIRVAEKDFGRLDEILAPYYESSQEMGILAREEWERWFQPSVLPWRTLQWIYDIFLSRPHSEVAYVALWPLMAWHAKWPAPFPVRVKNKLRRIVRERYFVSKR
jgi:hypothetical protein